MSFRKLKKMAFSEYRNLCEDSESHELDIERFAYDIFAYMLPICGFPKSKIPVTVQKENIYTEDDLIMNVGLSVLPIALYMRDDWKSKFEFKLEEARFRNILDIAYFLKSMLVSCPDYEEEDTLSKIQFSLALYNEIFLFFNYKSIETYFDSLPRTWSQFCSQLIAESDDIDGPLSSLLIMNPDVSEAWITNFVKNEAIPYGSSEGVSERFCVYSLENEVTNDSTNNVTDAESVAQEPDVQNKEPSLPKDSTSESYFLPGRWDFRNCPEKFQASREGTFLETEAHISHTNGLNYVLHHCLKGRKRNRSLRVEIEDALREISLENENVSPENPDTKRQRKILDIDELE